MDQFFYRKSLPSQLSTLYYDGSTIEITGESVTWPMIGSDLTRTTPAEFRAMIEASQKSFESDPHKIVISPDGPSRGLNIVFNVSSPPAGAAAALESVATFIESQFSDNITVTIDVSFASMGPGILGGTSNYYAGSVTWTNTRNGLVSGMDFNDSIQNWLPSGSTIPVRYVYTSSTVTNEDRCYFSRANYNATIGTVSGSAASMTFNSDFTWDYDPSNGITSGTVCFQSVAAHETGHVMGFVSGADFRTNDIEAMDVFRFQRSDGSGDYNPDNLTEFQTTARMVDKDDAGSYSNDVNSDLIDIEYQMSDGTPYQCSHFGQGQVYAVMQPAISYGQTYYPDFYKTPDLVIFDGIGWDYPITLTYNLTVNISGSGTVTKNPDQTSYLPGTPVQLTANPNVGWSFDHWSDSLTGSQNPDTITMNSNKTVTANFTQNQYTLEITIDGSGTVTKNPDQTHYTYGQQVILTANPGLGYAFDHWSGGLTGSQNPDTITIDGDESVTAHFTVAQYTLSTSVVGSGSVTKNPDQSYYAYGEKVELFATADTGWSFDHWSDSLTGSQNPDTITMNSNKTVTANFTQNQYTLEITIDGSGTVTKNPDQTHYTYGQQVELTADPEIGWLFDHWSGGLTGSANPDTISIDENESVSAYFVEDQYVEDGLGPNKRVPFFEIFPNPSAGQVSIRYGLSTESELFGRAELAIYDVSGQLIYSFPASQLGPSATHQPGDQILWQGGDNLGRKVPCGVYLFKFRAGDFQATKKLLFLR